MTVLTRYSFPGICAAGHWCQAGASRKDPTDGAGGLLCPPGHYCLEGTSPHKGTIATLGGWEGPLLPSDAVSILFLLCTHG